MNWGKKAECGKNDLEPEAGNPFDLEVEEEAAESRGATVINTDKGEFVVEEDKFYEEVNEQMAEDITEDAMTLISQLSDSPDDCEQVLNIVKDAMGKLLNTMKVPKPSSGSRLMSVMRAANMMGEPDISEIYSHQE